MTTELEALDAQPEGPIKLANGAEIEVLPLGTEQIFALFRIITNGLDAKFFETLFSDLSEDVDGVAVMLGIRLLLAIPNAPDEAISFLQLMTQPKGFIRNPKDKRDKEINEALRAKWFEGMANPDPMDTLEIIQRIVLDASENLEALGKKIQTMVALFRKVRADRKKTVSLED